jgi:hypothetical protein
MKPLFTPPLLLLLALAGCNNADDTTVDESASQQLIFSASLPDDEDTRMAFANETSPTLIWSEGDQIQVYSFERAGYNDISSGKFHKTSSCSMSSGAGTVNATFDGGSYVSYWIYDETNYGDSGSPYGLSFLAIYTKNSMLDNSSLSAGTATDEVKFIIPSTQSGDLNAQVCYTPKDTSFIKYEDTYYMSSSPTKTLQLQFTPATALIRLRLKLPEEYQDKEITASICSENPNHEIAGTGTLALKSGTIAVSDTGNTDGITASGTYTAASDGYTDIYFATLPTSGETTISITVGIAGIDDREYAITAKTDTKDNTFTVDGLKSGTRYTVKRNVVVSKR